MLVCVVYLIWKACFKFVLPPYTHTAHVPMPTCWSIFCIYIPIVCWISLSFVHAMCLFYTFSIHKYRIWFDVHVCWRIHADSPFGVFRISAHFTNTQTAKVSHGHSGIHSKSIHPPFGLDPQSATSSTMWRSLTSSNHPGSSLNIRTLSRRSHGILRLATSVFANGNSRWHKGTFGHAHHNMDAAYHCGRHAVPPTSNILPKSGHRVGTPDNKVKTLSPQKNVIILPYVRSIFPPKQTSIFSTFVVFFWLLVVVVVSPLPGPTKPKPCPISPLSLIAISQMGGCQMPRQCNVTIMCTPQHNNNRHMIFIITRIWANPSTVLAPLSFNVAGLGCRQWPHDWCSTGTVQNAHSLASAQLDRIDFLHA